MATTWLLVASPSIAATGAVQTKRLAGGGKCAFTQLGAVDWKAGLERPPVMSQRLGFADGRPSPEGAIVQAIQLRWGGAKADVDALASLYWRDAAFTLYSGPEGGADASFAVVLSGKIADVTKDGAYLTLELVDPSADLAKPIISATFAGSGGIEGPAELKGKPKRRALGRCYNVDLWPLDPANNIWVITDPARPLQAIDAVKDRGNFGTAPVTVAWAGSVASTLAALIAATPPAGGAAIAPSISAIKWWFANPGKLTADIRGEIGAGYIDRPADIAATVAGWSGGPAVDTGMLSAARAARNAEAGYLIGDSDTSYSTVIADICAGASLWWGLSATGSVELGSYDWGSSAASIVAATVKRIATHRPLGKIILGWKPNYTPMSRGDLAQSLFDQARYPDPAPAEMSIGAFYIGQNNRQFQFTGTRLMLGLDPVYLVTDPIYDAGYVSVQDSAIPAAQLTATTALAAATSALADLSNISSDGVLTPLEKGIALEKYRAITAEQAGIGARATAYSITTEKATYDAAITALSAYLATLTSPVLWSDLTGITTADGATFRLKFGDVYNARQALLNAVDAAAGQVAIWSGVSGTGKPEDLADVTLLVTGDKTVQLAFEYTGAIKTDELPLDANFKLIAGASSDVTTSATWTATLKSGAATFSIGAATGTLNVTAFSSDAVIEVKATLGSKVRVGALTLVKKQDPPPASGTGSGTSASASINTSGITSTYGTSPTGVLTTKAGTGGQVVCSASVDFSKVSNGTVDAYGKWQWRVVGGSFADITSEVFSSNPAVRTGAPEPSNEQGLLTVNMTKTGLTSGTNYEFQFLMRSAGANINASGYASAVGS